MTFGETLCRLRKGKGLSQEALAEQLNTTRQAVSKWENNQGYPETEKLLLLSNIFGVSVDQLLKGNVEQAVTTEQRYYVSKECAEEFLAFHRKTTMRTAIGVAIMILAGVPYFYFAENQILSSALACVMLLMGLAFILRMAMMGNPYKTIKSERLVFDASYFSELTFRYNTQKKMFFVLVFCGIALNCIGIILEYVESPLFPMSVIQCILVAFAIGLFVYAVGIMDTYDILMRSEERMNSVYWRVIKRIKKGK